MTAALHEPVEYDKWRYFNYENVIFNEAHITHTDQSVSKKCLHLTRNILFFKQVTAPHILKV